MKLAAVTMSNAQECIGKTRAHALIKVIETLVANYDEIYHIYQGRNSTVIMDGQVCQFNDFKGPKGGVRNIEYGHERLIMSFSLPNGKRTPEFYSMEALANDAIVALTSGKYLFEGQANRRLDSGIYQPTMPGKFHTLDVTGSLTIIEATYGRFLVGCGDSYAMLDRNFENEFIPIAIARILTHLYPADKELKRSYDWIKRNAEPNRYFIDEIEYLIDEIFQRRHFCLDDFFKHIEEHPESLEKLPFTGKKR